MGWSLLPNALRPFKIYCAPLNLGITRTWICRLNFAHRPILSRLRLFNELEISDSGPQLKVPPGGLVLRIFASWKKSIDLSRVWTRETTEADCRSCNLHPNIEWVKFMYWINCSGKFISKYYCGFVLDKIIFKNTNQY